MSNNTKVTKAQIDDAFSEAVKMDNRCNLGKVLDATEHRKAIEAKVADDLNYSSATISRVLKQLGFPPVSSETVSKHRKGACRCR